MFQVVEVPPAPYPPGVMPAFQPLQTMPPTDPVLSALIAKLPPGGSVWPLKKRVAWMQMLWLSFDLVYEAEAGEAVDLPSFLQAGSSAPAAPIAAAAAEPPKAKPAPYAFYIDREGYARRADGEQIFSSQVGGVLYDLRGEGDLGSIIWADGSTGVRGLTIDISPAAA